MKKIKTAVPFTLDEWNNTYDDNSYVETRDHREVKIISTEKSGEFPVVALIEMPGGNNIIRCYGENGEHEVGVREDEDLFIINVEPKFTAEEEELADILGYSYPDISDWEEEVAPLIDRVEKLIQKIHESN